MSQISQFDPSRYPSPAPQDALGDRRDGAVYEYTPSIELAVRVALATGRPLLVRGLSGCGKSSLARHVARVLDRDFIEEVVTSRTQAQDLLWTVDHIRRLRDAQADQLRPLKEYVEPGVLWRAFDPEGARRQSGLAAEKDPGSPPAGHVGETVAEPALRRAVVLLDEIDKADPDVPNNLLVALGSLEFSVGDAGQTVRVRKEMAPLIVLTTNNERDLPGAFLRRCVELRIPPPDRERLIAIARLHFPEDHQSTVREAAALLVPESLPRELPDSMAVSVAEFLDTVRACVEMGVAPGSESWKELARITVFKHGRSPVE